MKKLDLFLDRGSAWLTSIWFELEREKTVEFYLCCLRKQNASGNLLVDISMKSFW